MHKQPAIIPQLPHTTAAQNHAQHVTTVIPELNLVCAARKARLTRFIGFRRDLNPIYYQLRPHIIVLKEFGYNSCHIVNVMMNVGVHVAWNEEYLRTCFT